MCVQNVRDISIKMRKKFLLHIYMNICDSLKVHVFPDNSSLGECIHLVMLWPLHKKKSFVSLVAIGHQNCAKIVIIEDCFTKLLYVKVNNMTSIY